MTTRLAAGLAAIILAVIVVSGVVFRLAEYAGDRSLWLDEAMLYRNVHTLPLGELVAGRLRGDQCAPGGFLLATRAVMAVAGDSELALRFIPQAAGLALLITLAALAWRRLNCVGMATCVALAAWSWLLVYYSGEFKQYSLDALIGLLLFALGLDVLGRPFSTRRAVGVGLAGLAALFFSQPALFILAALGTVGLASAVRQRCRPEAVRWVLAGAAWVALFAGQMWVGYDSVLGDQALRDYHRELILNPWTWEQISGALEQGLLNTWVLATSAQDYWAWALVVALGGWAAWRRERREVFLIGGTFGFTLAASLLGVYPLAPRLLLFLLPLLFWLAGRGMGWVAESWQGKAAPLAGLLAAILLWPMLSDSVAEAHDPIHREHLRPVLARVAAAARPGDVILVWGPTAPAFEYYWPRVDHADIPVDVLPVGPDKLRPPAEIALLVAPLTKGRGRVWLVSTHDDQGASRDNLRALIQAIMRTHPHVARVGTDQDTALAVRFDQMASPNRGPAEAQKQSGG
jgi:hypothetical protein